MSHTGKRNYYRNVINRFTSLGHDFLTKNMQVVKPTSQSEVDLKFEGDGISGEIKGGGDVVLVGLSSGDEFDPLTIFDGAEKGVAVGYTQSSLYFNIYTNNGTESSPAVTTVTELSRYKDNENHNFEIIIYSDKITVKFDGEENTLTSNIPASGSDLKLVTKGLS